MIQLTIMFLVNGDEVLLAMKKRGFGQGRWNGVGGKVEKGETVQQSVIRECQEEIDVTPTNHQKIADIYYDEQHKGVREKLHVHAFLCTKWQGKPIESEEMAPKWFKISKLPYKEMWDDDPYWLPQIFTGQKLKCKFTLDENDKVSHKEVREVARFNND